jgi:membrane-associated phospholipid phosphatase
MRAATSRRTLATAIGSTAFTLVTLGLFIALTAAAALSAGLHEPERAFLQKVVAFRTPALTSLALAVTVLGSTAVTAGILGVVVATAWIRQRSIGALVPVLAWSGTLLSVLLIKALIGRVRPDPGLWLTHFTGASYPSQHAALSACTFTIVPWLATAPVPQSTAKRFPWGALTALALLIAGSRLYLGVHYPTDVVGGLCLGLFWTSVVAGAFRNRPSNVPSIESPARSPGSRR